MAHYIDADRLRARIEKKLQENADKALVFGAAFAGRTAEDNEIINLLDTLPEQPVEGLEEEITRYLREECSSDNEPSVSEIARHFAEWGAEHLKR